MNYEFEKRVKGLENAIDSVRRGINNLRSEIAAHKEAQQPTPFFPTDEQKRCPSCASAATHVNYIGKPAGNFHIHCTNCQMSSPEEQSEPSAWQAWADLHPRKIDANQMAEFIYEHANKQFGNARNLQSAWEEWPCTATNRLHQAIRAYFEEAERER